MKTIAFVFLSMFIVKACHPKIGTTTNNPVTDVVNTQVLTTGSGNSPAENTEIAKNEIMNDPNVSSNLDQVKLQSGLIVMYEASSRGLLNKVTFENNQISLVLDRNNPEKVDTVVLAKAAVAEIMALVNLVNLEELPKLKAPSDARTYDGAAHANLIITAKGKVYGSSGFDAGRPPAAIEKLVTKLVSYTLKK